MKVAAILLATLSFVALAEDLAVVGPSTETQFLPDRVGHKLFWLTAYGLFPTASNGLDDAAMKAVIAKWHPVEWGRYIKAALVPNAEFVAANVKLVSASEFAQLPNVALVASKVKQLPNFREDVLFLRYRVANRDYLLVETEGWEGQFMLFVRLNSKGMDASVNIADIACQTLSLRGAAWIGLEGGGCLLVDKSKSATNHPASEPLPDEWFAVLQRHAREEQELVGKKAQERERRRKGDEDYVKSLCAKLPDNDRTKAMCWDQYLALTKKIQASPDDSKEREELIGRRASVIDQLEMQVEAVAKRKAAENR